MAELLMPNMLATYNQGTQVGKQNRFAQLAGQAYSAAPAQQNALVGQAVGVDPRAGLQLGSQLATINSDRQATAKAAEVDHMKKLGGAARYMAQALKSNNPAQVEGAWQAVRPYLAEVSGKEPPPQWDPAMEPALYQAIAATGGDIAAGMPAGFQQFELTARAAGLQPGTPEYQQAARIALGSEGRASSASIGFQKVTGADGRERIGRSNPRTGAFEVYNEQTGQFEPMGEGMVGPGAPAAMSGEPMPQRMTPQQIMAQATQMANQGGPGANDAQARAWLQQQMEANGYAQQAPDNSGLAVSRSPEETAAATEAAKQRVGLEFLPQTEAIKAQAAVQQAGGTAAAKNAAEKQANFPKNRAAVIAGNAELDRLAGAARDVLNAGGLGRITGIMGAFPNVPGTEAADTQAKLDTLKSQVGFSVLQNMRDNSPTGGALGQVSDRENEMLQNNLAALGQAQSEEEYRRQLQKIIDYAESSKQRRLDALQATYGQAAQQPSAPAAAPAGVVDDLLSKYGVH